MDEKTYNANGASSTLEHYLYDLIEGMRPKLLDLSRRNPLLATPFSERSHSIIRVIDEVPSYLFEKLLTETMRIVPLPSLEEDPKDEQTDVFINTVSSARYTDEEYLREIGEIDQEQEDYEQKYILIERNLKDRIRVHLGMPERQTKNNLSLNQHAKNHHLNPSYDLDSSIDDQIRGHADSDIQTLLLPEPFERRLNSIISKVRLWQQETGISVLHVAFGFLEWADVNGGKTSMAPLVLMPASVEKIRKPTGVEFHISSEGELPQENVVLSEKLRIDHSIELPNFAESESLEIYINTINDSIPKHLKWRVRNQVAVGVFPSAKMAMYHDLDTKKWDFSRNEILSKLFLGNESSATATPFADDYNVDDPTVEKKVPYLVTEADSSQFSTLVDLAENKNIAVEGPPGSGKSQTIVNAIANALHDGKKVLFVAEKTAALEVVKARLEAFNLGEFILPLLASRNMTRSSIIESIRERIALNGYHVDEIRNLKSIFSRNRNQIKEYTDVLGSKFWETGLTVHEILGQRLKYEEQINCLPDNLKMYEVTNLKEYDEENIRLLYQACVELEEAVREYSQCHDYWKTSNVTNLTPFTAEQILSKISKCSGVFQLNIAYREKLNNYGFDEDLNKDHVIDAKSLLDLFIKKHDTSTAKMFKKIFIDNSLSQVEKYIYLVEEYRAVSNKLNQIVILDVPHEQRREELKELLAICHEYRLNTLSIKELSQLKHKYEVEKNELKYIYEFITESIRIIPEISDKTPFNIAELCYVASLASKEVLAARAKDFEDPLFVDYLKKQINIIKKLRDENIELSKIFYTERVIDVKEIQIHSDTLNAAGPLRIFSSKYRSAKTYYKSIAKEQYTFEKAKQLFAKLTVFISKKSEIENNETLKGLLRYKYEGINTDISNLADVLKYYKNVDENFTHTDDHDLKELLLNGDANRLRSLPKPILEKCQNLSNYGGLDTVESKLNNIEMLLSDYSKDEAKVVQKLHALTKQEVPVDELQEAVQMLEKLCHISTECDNEYVKRLVIGNQNKETVDLEWLKQIIDYYRQIIDQRSIDPEKIFNLLYDNSYEEFALLLGSIITSDNDCHEVSGEISNLLKSIPSLLESQGRREILEWAKKAQGDRDGLLKYSKLNSYKQTVSEFGFKGLIEDLSSSDTGLNSIKNKIYGILLNNLANAVYQEYGNKLAKYSGVRLNSLREQFSVKDKEIQDLASYYIAEQLVQKADPPAGINKGPKRTWTEYSLINSEIAKKQRYISPRDLTRRAGKALLEIKPCWMMSPLSVAQYISKGNIEFDLLIIDEASQMTPENAVGAISRSKQTMIVGDTNQLPPTSFFKKFIAVDEHEEEDSVTEESILEIANSAFRPARRLRWHYRSEHSSLIAFSNKYVYDNDLTIYPSAYEENPTMGVSVIKVDGLYSSGSNPKEASTIVEYIIKYMTENQDRSLGVVTVNQKQRDLLSEEFEYAINNNYPVQDYLNKWEEKNNGLESFFIKNLENVQGDERDTIFIGTVYGPNSPGAKVLQRFGPINGVAGKRRLNVLFTRAKKQIITFSSMSPSDILAENDANPGAYLLKQWLEYSATNILESGEDTYREPDSPFEEYVIAQIESMGCTAIPQVGVSGYFVDIGVKHPRWPHGYILGVECDGAAYHSSKSARDRDRLREEVLRKLGWDIYRIWSTDWFENPREEAEKLRKYIINRIEELIRTRGHLYESTNQISIAERSQIQERVSDTVIEEDDLDDEIEKENSFTIAKAKSLLIRLRDSEIAEEFEEVNSDKCILNDNMLEILLLNKPATPREFREYVPLSLRDKIDHQQMIYLNTILDITKRIQ